MNNLHKNEPLNELQKPTSYMSCCLSSIILLIKMISLLLGRHRIPKILSSVSFSISVFISISSIVSTFLQLFILLSSECSLRYLIETLSIGNDVMSFAAYDGFSLVCHQTLARNSKKYSCYKQSLKKQFQPVYGEPHSEHDRG
jgi:hypothetical protein